MCTTPLSSWYNKEFVRTHLLSGQCTRALVHTECAPIPLHTDGKVGLTWCLTSLINIPGSFLWGIRDTTPPPPCPPLIACHAVPYGRAGQRGSGPTVQCGTFVPAALPHEGHTSAANHLLLSNPKGRKGENQHTLYTPIVSFFAVLSSDSLAVPPGDTHALWRELRRLCWTTHCIVMVAAAAILQTVCAMPTAMPLLTDRISNVPKGLSLAHALIFLKLSFLSAHTTHTQ